MILKEINYLFKYMGMFSFIKFFFKVTVMKIKIF